ncbi:LysE/ArgO family amino acid transporter [Gorillibacterium timonense]|uniref:LysE/ArgO family amino acid transporter n=1 Tax=Gorillibacterium timonense TaxID=1689269 RepID=UPI00071DB305|nr:LysE family transporter [Gorillibacterium timonense]
MQTVLHGFFLSLGLIFPLGVQNVFVFSQGANQLTIRKALPAALTAGACDTLLISSAIFGLAWVVLRLEWLRLGLMGVGIVFLLIMGGSIWKAKVESLETGGGMPLKKQILFTLSVSLLNPHAILDTIGVIGTSSLRYAGAERLVFAVTCISVSWCWFIGLVFVGSAFKKLDKSARLLRTINRCSAIFIWCTALLLLKTLLDSIHLG